MLTTPFASRGARAAALFVVLQALPMIALADRTQVEIELNEAADIADSLVTLADIAEISRGDPAVRHRVGQLDIAEIGAAPDTETVKRSQIELRLQLAGIDPADYVLSGSSQTTITRRHAQIDDEKVIQVVRAPLAQRWNVDPSSLQLRLSRPLSAFVKSLPTQGDGRLEPFLRDNLLPGRLRISIGMYDGEDLIKTFAVSLDASIRRRVAIANTRLRPGHLITPDDIGIEQRDLSGRAALEVADPVINQTTKRWVQAGKPIRTHDLYPPGRSDPVRVQVVKRNSVVQLVARKKGLRVTVPNGVLIRDARVGESVAVRNPTSQKTVIGRLVSPSEVEVSF